MKRRTLVWFRGKELRLSDHEPLFVATRDGDVIPVFVLDPYFFAPDRARELPHRMQYLLESLDSLAKNIAHLGSRLIIVRGKSVHVIPELAERWRVDRVVAQRWTEPFGRERDRRITAKLRVPFDLFGGETLLPPETVRTGSKTPFSVFTPFSRAFSAQEASIGKAFRAPRKLPPIPEDVLIHDTVAIPTLGDLGIAHNPNLTHGGEAAATKRLRAYVRGPLSGYATHRDQMSTDGTSHLSADLKFGTLSPRTVWSAVQEAKDTSADPRSAQIFLNQLIWREFAYSSLWDRPELLEKPFRSEFVDFPWQNDETAFRCWTEGNTGYPIVDAAARQLVAEGFVHNRARMIAASFLTKHLLIDFRWGEAHYMKYLVDGDWANNDMGWQWSAGTGCDAQPYFRVFNPTLQGERFDQEGGYVKRWLPQLARLPPKYIHRPWEAPDALLKASGVVLGETYPRPCIDHAFGRARFLRIAEDYLASQRAG